MKFLAKLEVKVLKAQFRIQGFELGLLQIIYLKWGTEFSTKKWLFFNFDMNLGGLNDGLS